MANIIQSLGQNHVMVGLQPKCRDGQNRGPEEPEPHVCCNSEDRERAAPVPPALLQKERKEPSLGEVMCISGGVRGGTGSFNKERHAPCCGREGLACQ